MKTLQKLMAVEDDADIRRILELALATFGGFELTCCESGQAALAALEQDLPDLILLDVMMPGMDGPATLQAIRSRPALTEIPVVFLTAKLQPEEVNNWIALGALSVIGKPFDPLALPDELRRLHAEQIMTPARAPARGERLPPELEVLRPDYLARVHRDLDRLETLASRILDCGMACGCHAELAELHPLLHGLAGSAGGFGYTELGRQCRELDHQSGIWLRHETPPSLREWHRFAADLLLLRQILT